VQVAVEQFLKQHIWSSGGRDVHAAAHLRGFLKVLIAKQTMLMCLCGSDAPPAIYLMAMRRRSPRHDTLSDGTQQLGCQRIVSLMSFGMAARHPDTLPSAPALDREMKQTTDSVPACKVFTPHCALGHGMSLPALRRLRAARQKLTCRTTMVLCARWRRRAGDMLLRAFLPANGAAAPSERPAA